MASGSSLTQNKRDCCFLVATVSPISCCPVHCPMDCTSMSPQTNSSGISRCFPITLWISLMIRLCTLFRTPYMWWWNLITCISPYFVTIRRRLTFHFSKRNHIPFRLSIFGTLPIPVECTSFVKFAEPPHKVKELYTVHWSCCPIMQLCKWTVPLLSPLVFLPRPAVLHVICDFRSIFSGIAFFLCFFVDYNISSRSIVVNYFGPFFRIVLIFAILTTSLFILFSLSDGKSNWHPCRNNRKNPPEW